MPPDTPSQTTTGGKPFPPWIADIYALSKRFRDKVNDLHDDFLHTRMLWQAQLVEAARGGTVLQVHNPITKNIVSTGAELAARARTSQSRSRARCFKDLTTQFELFVDELLRLWLTTHTSLISARALTVATILAGTNLADLQAAAIAEAVEATILDKLKGKPEGWLRYLKENLGCVYRPGDEASFLEMKARRDVLEHHSGIVEDTYLKKAQHAARYKAGDEIDVRDRDVDDTHGLIVRMIEATANSAVAKAAAPASS